MTVVVRMIVVMRMNVVVPAVFMIMRVPQDSALART